MPHPAVVGESVYVDALIDREVLFPPNPTDQSRFRIANVQNTTAYMPVTWNPNGSQILIPNFDPEFTTTSIPVVMPWRTIEFEYVIGKSSWVTQGIPFPHTYHGTHLQGRTYPQHAVAARSGWTVIANKQTANLPFNPDETLNEDWNILSVGGIVAEQRLVLSQTGPDIGAGWTPIPMDTVVLDDIGIVPYANGEFQFLFEGVWRVDVTASVSHNSSNQGRTTNLRLFNITDGTPGTVVPVGIGRNVEDTLESIPVYFEIGPGDINDLYRVEIGGGSSLTSVVWNTTSQMFRFEALP